jgi:signal transduction histidine kinase
MHDVLVTIATFAVTAMVVWNGEIAVTRPTERHPHWFVLGLVAVGVLPLLMRRTLPLVAFATSTAALGALAVVDAPIGLPLASGVALYAVASQRTATERRGRLTLVVAGGFVYYVACCAIAIGVAPWSELLHTALLWSACWLAGERARLQREQLEELRRDAQRERALATAEERMRIARDLHDAAGHAINVIAVQAGAARLRHHEHPDRSLVALSTIEELARSTAAEIDRMVGGLREVSERRDTAPASLQSLRTLVGHHLDTGLRVEVDVTGAQQQLLPPAVDQAAYRIVQEGLTNASRHGCGPADVQLDFGHKVLTITIRNPMPAVVRRGRNGHGLVGAAERASLVGGALDTTVQAGTFVLNATLPIIDTGPR